MSRLQSYMGSPCEQFQFHIVRRLHALQLFSRRYNLFVSYLFKVK
jgi:hypothetical protein